MKTVPTTILDACCGGRMFYFEKNHPNVLYIDRRFETVEMKRKKGGATSANQKQWIKTLNEAGVQTVVCKGCDEAIEFIESITKP